MSFQIRRPPVTPLLVVRSSLFFIGLALATLVIAPVVIVGFALPYRARYAIVYQWTVFNTWWLNVTCGLTHMVEGKEHIPAKPAIVLCKHQSAWETINLQHYFYPQVWVLKRELLRLPVFGWGLAMMRPIAIDRGAGRDAMTQVLEQGARRLESGCWVVIFPEGTRVAPGTKRRYKLGGATLAEKTGVPVIPVAHDAGLYWPRKSFIKFPGVIQLVIGPPIESRGKTASEINSEAEAWIEATVTRLITSDRAHAAMAPESAKPVQDERRKTG